MSQVDVEIERLTLVLSGVVIGNTKCDSFLDISLQKLKFDDTSLMNYGELVELMCSDGYLVNNLCLVQFLLQYGEIASNRSLMKDDYFFKVFGVKYCSNMRVTKDNGTIKYLLMKGLDNHNKDSWKYLDVLTRILSEVIRSKSAITNIIKTEFALKVGHLLNTAIDFQSLNYITELLANCFPRKSFEKPGVVLPPLLWENDNTKNKLFFNRRTYPFRGVHGDHQTLEFIWELFSENLKSNTKKVKHINYSLKNKKSSSNKITNDKDCKLIFVQVYKQKIYVWVSDAVFFIINRKFAEITNVTKGKLRISITNSKDGLNIIRDISKVEIPFSEISFFDLEFQNKSDVPELFNTISSVPRVSETTTFLSLKNTEIYEDTYKTPDVSSRSSNSHEEINEDIPIGKTPKELEVLLSESFPLASQNIKNIQAIEEEQVPVTPENSTVNMAKDKWDMEREINDSEDAHPVKSHLLKNIQKNSRLYENKDNEISPIVLLQQNKLRRETQNKNSTLMSSLMVIEEKKISDDMTMKKPNVTLNKLLMDKDRRKSPIESKLSIQPKDIQLLDAIFSKPDMKKLKRQQKLNLPSSNKRRKKNEPKVVQPVKYSLSKIADKDKELEKEKELRKEKVNDYKTKTDKQVKQIPKIEKDDAQVDETKTIIPKEKKDNTPPTKKSIKRPRSISVNKIIEPEKEKSFVEPPNILNVSEVNHSIDAESTTLINSMNVSTDMNSMENIFTIQLQNQIAASISKFSNEITKKIAIINNELNNRLITEISQKYQNLINDLQKNFQQDTEKMLNFVGDIKHLINLPEDQLLESIRNQKFG